MTIAIDGTPAQNLSGSGSSFTLTLTTTTSGLVCVCVETNGGPTVSVVGASLGSFTKRADALDSGHDLNLWYKASGGPLTSEVITVTMNSSNFFSGVAWGVKNINATPFDPNGALPYVVGGFPSDPLSITTSNANDMLLYMTRGGDDPNPQPPTGYSEIGGTHGYMIAAYKIVAATQSAVSVSATGGGYTNGGIADALQEVAAAVGGILVPHWRPIIPILMQ